jgi:hypothetical protein
VHYYFCVFLARVLHHIIEYSLLLYQLHGLALLRYPSLLHHYHVVIVCDSSQPMRYRDHCRIIELLLYYLLNELTCLCIDFRRRLVEDQKSVLSKKGSGQT